MSSANDNPDLPAVGNNGLLEKEARLLASTMGINVSSFFSHNSSDATVSQDEINLHCAILKLSEMESKYIAQVQQLRAKDDGWKTEHEQLKTQYEELLVERDDEAVLVNALENKLNSGGHPIGLRMQDRLTNFVAMHETTEQDYEFKLVLMKDDYDEIRASKDELSFKFATLERENEVLQAELKEANTLVVSSVRGDIEMEMKSQES